MATIGNEPVLNVGVIGLGGAAAAMIPVFGRDPHFRVAAAADIDEGMLDNFRRDVPGPTETFGSAEALCKSPNVDVVYIATPNQFHVEHGTLALENGKHVHMEKPMTLSLEDADLLVNAAERNGLSLTVNVKHSFEPRVHRIRQMVGSGELGQLRMINYWYFASWLYSPRTSEELNHAMGGGVPWRQGPHQIDIIRTIGGGRVRSVRAMTGWWDASRPVAGCYAGYLDFEDGPVATAVYSGYDHFNSRELTYRVDRGDSYRMPEHARGRKALAQVDDKAAEIAMKRSRRYGMEGREEIISQQSEWILGGPLVVSFDKGDVRLTPNGLQVYGDAEKEELSYPPGPQDGRDGAIDQVYNAVVHGRPAMNSGRWGKATLEVLLALFQSGEERREIFLQHQVPTVDY